MLQIQGQRTVYFQIRFREISLWLSATWPGGGGAALYKADVFRGLPGKKWLFFLTQTSGIQIVTGKRHAQNNQGRGRVAAVSLAKGLTVDTMLS